VNINFVILSFPCGDLGMNDLYGILFKFNNSAVRDMFFLLMTTTANKCHSKVLESIQCRKFTEYFFTLHTSNPIVNE